MKSSIIIISLLCLALTLAYPSITYAVTDGIGLECLYLILLDAVIIAPILALGIGIFA